MLVLSRQRDQVIEVGGGFSVGGIDVTVVDVRGGKVRLGITAPKDVSVHRAEVAARIRSGQRGRGWSGASAAGFDGSDEMNINVPEWAREHFWQEPPPNSEEFWSFRFPPPCKVGEKLHFRFDGETVATANVSRIEAPGLTKCNATGRFGGGHKVFWSPESFVDLRPYLPGNQRKPAGSVPGDAGTTNRQGAILP